MENISMQDKLGSMVEDVVKTKKLNTDSLIEKDIKSS
jgi:hypothetical protein|tara:strand:+ start:197 stop:307 length:111 start_codon:yes stop_codon:yes gene_type:complete